MARAALLMLTVYDDEVGLLVVAVDEELLVLDVGAVEVAFEAEPDVTADPVAPVVV